MKKAVFKTGPIPGISLEMSKHLWSGFLKSLVSRFRVSYQQGKIRYSCAKSGESETSTYHIVSYNRRTMKRVENFITAFKKGW